MKKIIFSGVKPSGNVHIGNYLGAIRHWVKNQSESTNFFCIVDLHSITVEQQPEILAKNNREAAALLMASGINPEISTVFIQSHVPAHTELAWILNCFTPMGWMKKMTQYKEKSEKLKEKVSVGLFDYPILMAADILLYDTDIVPVGEDQKQHVELARDIALRFNHIYNQDVFHIPAPFVAQTGARIMGLAEPTKKMSKSDDSKGNFISLLDLPEEVAKKISKAKTDTLSEIRFDSSRPGIYNLLVIFENFSELSRDEIEKMFKDKGYAYFKEELTNLINSKLKPIQEKYNDLMNNPSKLDLILKSGAEKARTITEKKVKTIKDLIGLG